MTDNSDIENGSIHIYRVKWWLMLYYIVLALLFFGVFPFLTFIQARTLDTEILTGDDLEIIRIFFQCLLAPLFVGMGLVMIQAVINMITFATSRIRITSNGIEENYWPYRHIRCSWSEVDKMGKFQLFNDVIFLKSYEKLGPMLSLKPPFNFFMPKQMFIALSGYKGWPKGQLAEDLKRFAPHLLESQPESQLLQPGSVMPEHPSGVSQEERLLAALAHAAILSTPLGIIVSAVLWTTHNKKSPYVGFQALQALVWQLLLFGFQTIFSIFLMVGYLLLILAASAGNNPPITPSLEAIFLIATMVLCLLPVGSLAFIVYGLAGAFGAYQGKDFHYPVIGKRLKHSR